MNATRISLALATLALLSTGSAFAQSVDVNAGPVGVYAAPSNGLTLMSPVRYGSGLVGRMMNPPGAWFDLSVLGMGITLGGTKRVVQVGSTPSAYFVAPSSTLLGTTMQTREFARVIPGSLTMGSAMPVSASVAAPKPLAHVDLFGMRLFRLGSVAPSLDMRDP